MFCGTAVRTNRNQPSATAVFLFPTYTRKKSYRTGSYSTYKTSGGAMQINMKGLLKCNKMVQIKFFHINKLLLRFSSVDMKFLFFFRRKRLLPVLISAYCIEILLFSFIPYKFASSIFLVSSNCFHHMYCSGTNVKLGNLDSRF